MYAQNNHQLCFLHKLRKKLEKIKQGELLLRGDFNILPDPQIYSTSFQKHTTASLQPLLHAQNLFDVWRCLHTTERDYSYFSTSHNFYSRIDLFIVDKWLLQKIQDASIREISWSDHAPIIISIAYLSLATHISMENKPSVATITRHWSYFGEKPDLLYSD